MIKCVTIAVIRNSGSSVTSANAVFNGNRFFQLRSQISRYFPFTRRSVGKYGNLTGLSQGLSWDRLELGPRHCDPPRNVDRLSSHRILASRDATSPRRLARPDAVPYAERRRLRNSFAAVEAGIGRSPGDHRGRSGIRPMLCPAALDLSVLHLLATWWIAAPQTAFRLRTGTPRAQEGTSP